MDVSNKELSELFEDCITYCKCSRLQKLLKSPLKLIRIKFLEIVSKYILKNMKVKVKTFWNDDMVVILPEGMSLDILRYRFYEESVAKYILEYLKPGMIFFDIGAHFGFYTILGSKIVGNNGKVYAFEPTPDIFKILRSNIAEKSNVKINNIAVFSKSTNLVFSDYGIIYSGLNSLYPARIDEKFRNILKPHKYDVRTISLDQYSFQINLLPDFIKIDAENSEYEILLGAEDILKNKHPIIIVEVGDINIEKNATSKELILYLKKYGYQAYEYINRNIVKHCLKEQYRYDNILFLY